MSGWINGWEGVGGVERGRAEGERCSGGTHTQKEKEKVRKEEERKKISDVHKSPVVAADAVRPDGCTLANDGETHGDAPLRAHIINRAHTIFPVFI